jgi:hypothetical protein
MGAQRGAIFKLFLTRKTADIIQGVICTPVCMERVTGEIKKIRDK